MLQIKRRTVLLNVIENTEDVVFMVSRNKNGIAIDFACAMLYLCMRLVWGRVFFDMFTL